MATRRALLSALPVAAAALAACGNGSTNATKTTTRTPAAIRSSAEATEEALPPVIRTPEELAGTSVTITLTAGLYISVDDVTGWTGTTEDAGIAMFHAGADDGSQQSAPYFMGHGTGTTGATLTGPDGVRYVFTIVVEESIP